MTRTVALVACVAEKATEPAPAADLYRSDLFRKARAVAEHADTWRILSAVYGAVTPTASVAPYNRTLNTFTAAERRAWAADTAADLLADFPEPVTFVMLAGRAYADDLAPLLEAAGHVVLRPLAGLGIGEQKRALLVAARLLTECTDHAAEPGRRADDAARVLADVLAGPITGADLDALLAEDDPADLPCDACGALPREDCRPGCIGEAAHLDALAATEPPCAEYAEDGSCIHSEHMAAADAVRYAEPAPLGAAQVAALDCRLPVDLDAPGARAAHARVYAPWAALAALAASLA